LFLIQLNAAGKKMPDSNQKGYEQHSYGKPGNLFRVLLYIAVINNKEGEVGKKLFPKMVRMNAKFIRIF
jgi:hypothetical protein